jgi:hypothetical protein
MMLGVDAAPLGSTRGIETSYRSDSRANHDRLLE